MSVRARTAAAKVSLSDARSVDTASCESSGGRQSHGEKVGGAWADRLRLELETLKTENPEGLQQLFEVVDP